MDVPAPLWTRANAAAQWLATREAAGDTVTVVHHVDADGISAGAIALEALARLDVPHRAHLVKSLDDAHIKQIQATEPEALWFCDLGSAAYMRFTQPKIVCDHHELVRDGHEESFPHVNPLLDELPGDSVSGAGAAYLVAAAAGVGHGLAHAALVGATGDLQDRKGWHGANLGILEQAKREGAHVEMDIAWYGPATRPLSKFLSLAEGVPTVTGDRRAARQFLEDMGLADVPWLDLRREERQVLRDEIARRALVSGVPAEELADLVRPVITLDAPGPLRELQEYATLLNSTGRYGKPEVGLAVVRGDRGAAYEEALDLLGDHRKHLVGALDAFARRGVAELRAVQWVHLGSDVRDTVVGIVCGMAFNGLGLRGDLALVGFADAGVGLTKVSARAPRRLQGDVDLADAVRTAALELGGEGGGHKGAAGATIPAGTEERFIERVDGIVAAQMDSGSLKGHSLDSGA